MIRTIYVLVIVHMTPAPLPRAAALEAALGVFPVVVGIGARQTGKSTLVRSIPALAGHATRSQAPPTGRRIPTRSASGGAPRSVRGRWSVFRPCRAQGLISNRTDLKAAEARSLL